MTTSSRRIAPSEQAGSKADLALELVSAEHPPGARRGRAASARTPARSLFYVHTPLGFDQLELEEICAREAVAEATRRAILRQNSRRQRHRPRTPATTSAPAARSSTGTSIGAARRCAADPQGRRLREHERPVFAAGHAGRQARRPRPRRRAQCILDAVWQAQGKGCGPGFLGVCIGGDRATGYEHAKEQLLRAARRHQPRSRAGRRSKHASSTRPTSSDIGPMGFGGKLTLGAARSARAIACRPRSSSAWPTCAGPTAAGAPCWTTSGDVDEWLY